MHDPVAGLPWADMTGTDHAVRGKRLAGSDAGTNLRTGAADLRSAPSLLGFSSRPHSLSAISAARADGGCWFRSQRPLDCIHRGARDVPGRRAGRDAPRWRGRVRPGSCRGKRQRALRSMPRRRFHYRACRPEAWRSGRAGRGGFAGGQPEPLPRHPPYLHLAPRSAGREPREGTAARARPNSAPARKYWRARGCRSIRLSASRNYPNWPPSRVRCPICRSFSTTSAG